jgi:hypothetical protein
VEVVDLVKKEAIELVTVISDEHEIRQHVDVIPCGV